MKKTQFAPGAAYGLVSALCVSGYLTVNKYIYAQYDVSAFQYSMLFAVMGGLYALMSLVICSKRGSYQAIRANLRPLIVLSIVGFLAVSIFIFGLRYTTTVNAALLVTSTIVATALFAYLLLGERFDGRQLGWVALLFVGLYIGIVGFSGLQFQKGDFIVLGSVLSFGFGNAYSRVVMRNVKHPEVVPDTRLAMGAVIAAVVIAFTVRDYGIYVEVLPLALLAGLFYWLCMKTFAKSVHLLNAHEAIVLNNGQIFSTSLAGELLLSEPYSFEKFLGSVIVIASVYFISMSKRVSAKSIAT